MDIKQYDKLVGSVAQEFNDSGLSIHEFFAWAIEKQNRMYELPVNLQPSLDCLGESPLKRIDGFMKTLAKEMKEGEEIQFMLKEREKAVEGRALSVSDFVTNAEAAGFDEKRIQALSGTFFNAMTEGGVDELDRQILVMIADWLGDMQVYNRSEAMKFGIPLEAVLLCIMGSNFTKLGANGEVLKDENGKFLKGPNFLPPEQHIYATLFEGEELAQEAEAVAAEAERLMQLSVPALYLAGAVSMDEDDMDMLTDADEGEEE